MQRNLSNSRSATHDTHAGVSSCVHLFRSRTCINWWTLHSRPRPEYRVTHASRMWNRLIDDAESERKKWANCFVSISWPAGRDRCASMHDMGYQRKQIESKRNGVMLGKKLEIGLREPANSLLYVPDRHTFINAYISEPRCTYTACTQLFFRSLLPSKGRHTCCCRKWKHWSSCGKKKTRAAQMTSRRGLSNNKRDQPSSRFDNQSSKLSRNKVHT